MNKSKFFYMLMITLIISIVSFTTWATLGVDSINDKYQGTYKLTKTKGLPSWIPDKIILKSVKEKDKEKAKAYFKMDGIDTTGSYILDTGKFTGFFEGHNKKVFFSLKALKGSDTRYLDGIVKLTGKNKKSYTVSYKMSEESDTKKSSKNTLNSEILKYAISMKGKKVDRGECWDLAAVPLKKYGAKWDGLLDFGELIAEGSGKKHYTNKGEEIAPGDIIQFKSVTIEWKKGNSWGTKTLGYPDHTAIIYKVKDRKNITLLHQNVDGKRYVVEEDIDLGEITKGSYKIYRPYK